MYKRDRFLKEYILDVQTHLKPTETFQYTNLYSCHLPSVRKGFIKGEMLRLLRTNSSQHAFEENIANLSHALRTEVTQQQLGKTSKDKNNFKKVCSLHFNMTGLTSAF